MPEWLRDSLLNTLSHIRSGWWQKNGRWRQWEAYDCVNIDSIHNDGERHIPYLLFFPDTVKSKLAGWGAGQQADGMLPEQLACGCMGPIDGKFKGDVEHPCGRVMSDVTTMYIQYFWELYIWNNDIGLIGEYWNNTLVPAINWQINTAKTYGVPERLVSTYDILRLEKWPVASYNSAMHLMAMKACMGLADVVNDGSMKKSCQDAYTRGQQTYDQLLWSQDHYACVGPNVNASIMSDDMYGQTLAFTSNLGFLLDDADKLKAHLDTVRDWTLTDIGLQIVQNITMQTGEQMWQMSNGDWAVNKLWIGASESLNAILDIPHRMVTNYRDSLKDFWNIAGIYNTVEQKGYPSITSHYGYAMTQWHTF
eukprot:UN32623